MVKWDVLCYGVVVGVSGIAGMILLMATIDLLCGGIEYGSPEMVLFCQRLIGSCVCIFISLGVFGGFCLPRLAERDDGSEPK